MENSFEVTLRTGLVRGGSKAFKSTTRITLKGYTKLQSDFPNLFTVMFISYFTTPSTDLKVVGRYVGRGNMKLKE